MTKDDFNEYCQSLPATTHVVQWGGSVVWKVGGKVFAIAGWSADNETLGVTFKVSPEDYDALGDQPGVRPAPYLAARGMKWLQHYAEPGLPDELLQAQIAESHRIVALGLSRKKRRELGLEE